MFVDWQGLVLKMAVRFSE